MLAFVLLGQGRVFLEVRVDLALVVVVVQQRGIDVGETPQGRKLLDDLQIMPRAALFALCRVPDYAESSLQSLHP